MTRLNKILIGAVAVQLLLAVFMLTRDNRVKIAPMKPLLVGFDSAKVKRIQAFDKNGDKAAIDLVKAGEAWTLASNYDYPVDATKVGDLLTKLAGLKSREPIANTPVRQQQLAVGDKEFERKLIVTTDTGDTTIFVGVATGGGRATPIRIGGEAKVFGATGLTSYGIEIQPARWIDTSYFQVEPDQITRILVQGPGGATELERSTAAPAPTPEPNPAAPGWQLTSAGLPVALGSGEAIDAAAVQKVVTEVSHVTVSQPGDPKRDASKPTATISLWVTPAATDPAGGGALPAERVADHVFDVITDGDNYWIHEHGRPLAAMAGSGGLKDVVEVSRDKLVAKPTPTPPGTPGKPGTKPGAPKPAAPQLPHPTAPSPPT